MRKEWTSSPKQFAAMAAVFLVGFVGTLLPEAYVLGLVGDNSLPSNLVASVIGAVPGQA